MKTREVKMQRKCSRMSVFDYEFHRHYKDDAQLKHLLVQSKLAGATNLLKKDLKGHYGCVNAIEFSHHGGDWIVSGGDDRRVLIWNVGEAILGNFKPSAMKAEHHSNIFCLAFDMDNKRIFSGGNDEQVIVHDVESGETHDVFRHEEAVYGLSVDPVNPNVFASACEHGKILIYDIRAPPSEDPFVLANYTSPMHAVMYNPMEPRLLATANSKEGVGLWDIRKPQSVLLKYGGSMSQQNCMSVRINSQGNQLVALRRRLPPVLYDIDSTTQVFQFDHSGYYNSCTLKSCCFAGDKDEYIVSGSDDFNLYMWKIPEKQSAIPTVGEAHLVLKGHRSIVNQVRFNPDNCLLVSSGVEKVIKVWSPFCLPDQETDTSDTCSRNTEPDRQVYSHEEYINLVLRSGQVMTHDYTNQSTEEDPRMMAFFDSLVQREIEGWSTDDSLESNSDFFDRFAPNSESDNSSSDQRASHSEDEAGYSPFTLAFASVMANRADGDTNHDENSLDFSHILDMDAHVQQERENNREGNQENEEENLSGDAAVERRRTISDIIAQKRKEYLEGVIKAEQEAHKNARAKVKKCKNDRKRSAQNADSSSVESSGSDNDSCPPSKIKQKHSQESDSTNALEKIREERQKKAQTLLRLKKIRHRLLHSDSDSNDGQLNRSYNRAAKSTSDNVCVKNNSAEPVPSTSGETTCKNARDYTKGDGEVTVGPYLTKDVIPKVVDDSEQCHRLAEIGHRESEEKSAKNSCQSIGSRDVDTDENHSSQYQEFKRFKHKVERTRRKYRQQSCVHENSSEDESS